MAQRTTATRFRSDQIGSLIRPDKLQDARDAYREGRSSLAELRRAEDAAIVEALAWQKGTGIDVFTDGEMRRDAWQTNIMQAVEGFEADYPTREMDIDGKKVRIELHGKAVTGRLKPVSRITAVDTAFLKAHSPGPFKITLPGPTTVGRAGWRPGVTDSVYPTRRHLYQALAEIIRDEMKALVAEGVNYIQLDEAFTSYARESAIEEMRARGEDPEALIAEQIEFENVCYDAVRGDGITLGCHLCRGSRTNAPKPGLSLPERTTRDFDWLAEQLFSQLHAHRFLFEWDSGFECLRFLPPDKTLVLGIVTSLDAGLESQDNLVRTIEAAARHCRGGIDQLALSSQCGFSGSGTRDGAHMSIDEEKRKIELVAETARKVWG